jgi:tetratricopeptide (TPR) repeat protein
VFARLSAHLAFLPKQSFGARSILGEMKNAGSKSDRKLVLPPAPPEESGAVKAWIEPVTMASYMPQAPDRNPMFLENRIYQGSSGRIYPLPFIDRIAIEPEEHTWQAVHMENEYVRVMLLPEIGGRIHVGFDKVNGYDFFYRQNVIKPALVGLAGPWISGGVEFNWPQHHRPSTFMPVDVEIERSEDGSVTVWCGNHDPMTRMKGMHGVCLAPGKSYIELKVRLYNRTQFTQTFLWWANVAARVHERYQSFFPPDVRYVADHAKRATTGFPLSDGEYYGVNYGERGRSGVPEEQKPEMFRPDKSIAANDLSWYANIPVPTSYMITGSKGDFFGGYDHAAGAGFVHVANHHIVPGKKQWTWGNHDFGYAWDRNLTDSDGPYIELMAGAYTDNQPDFSFLAPGETKNFSQYWYPIRSIGVPQAANIDGAIHLAVVNGAAQIGICVTHDIATANVMLRACDTLIRENKCALLVKQPLLLEWAVPVDTDIASLSVTVSVSAETILRHVPAEIVAAGEPDVAREPLAPAEIEGSEELYLTGLHLEQYRHATRSPEDYWNEAVRRDPADSRANNALGCWHLRRGEFDAAEHCLQAAIARLTTLNPNPYDGEAFYNLGLTLDFQGREQNAYNAFYKATWNAAWRGPAYHALAEIDVRRMQWTVALDHLHRSLTAGGDNLNARNLATFVLRKLGRAKDAEQMLAATRQLDPLDDWSRFLSTAKLPVENQNVLDLAFAYGRAHVYEDAIRILKGADLNRKDGSAAMILYTLADMYASAGDTRNSEEAYERAQQAATDYVFPSRLEEMLVLSRAIRARPEDARAPYYLGNLLYDRRRYDDAIAQWESAVELNDDLPTVWRNLGIAYFNVQRDEEKSLQAFDRALEMNPTDGRVFYERDQLWKRVGETPENRLAEFIRHADLVRGRDDLSVELTSLYNHTGDPETALELLKSRRFQPWEGGEGLVIAQYVRANLLIGVRALAENRPLDAKEQFLSALNLPKTLSEARHLLANQSDVYYWIGVASAAAGQNDESAAWWKRGSSYGGDFQRMSVMSISDMTFWTALAYKALGEVAIAEDLLEKILRQSFELEEKIPKIEYFATSLPAMLLFEEDLPKRNRVAALYLRSQACAGMERYREAEESLQALQQMDSNHAGAMDLMHNIARLKRISSDAH